MKKEKFEKAQKLFNDLENVQKQKYLIDDFISRLHEMKSFHERISSKISFFDFTQVINRGSYMYIDWQEHIVKAMCKAAEEEASKHYDDIKKMAEAFEKELEAL